MVVPRCKCCSAKVLARVPALLHDFACAGWGCENPKRTSTCWSCLSVVWLDGRSISSMMAELVDSVFVVLNVRWRCCYSLLEIRIFVIVFSSTNFSFFFLCSTAARLALHCPNDICHNLLYAKQQQRIIAFFFCYCAADSGWIWKGMTTTMTHGVAFSGHDCCCCCCCWLLLRWSLSSPIRRRGAANG